MSILLNVYQESNQSFTITLAGAIDSEAVEAFEATLKPLLEKDFPWIVFDFSKVTYITSSGLAAIVGIEKGLRALDKTLYVINASLPVGKVLAVLAALPGLQILKDKTALVEHLSGFKDKKPSQ